MDNRANSVFGSDDELSSTDGVVVDDTNSHRKRKRSSQKISCEMCKSRKVKCDRAEPACGWCSKHQNPCIYKERQRPGLRLGNALELEAKINRIDAMLQLLGRRVEEHIMQDHADPPRLPIPQSPGIGQQSPQAVLVQSDLGPASVGSNKVPYSEHWEFAPGSAPTEVQPTTTTNTTQTYTNGYVPESPAQNNQRPSPRPIPEDAALTSDLDLPPHDMLFKLVDLYFKHVNTWCPILDRKATIGMFFGSTSVNEQDRILLHAIVATTMRFLNDPTLTHEQKKHYHDVSKHKVELYGLDHVNVKALKALVILALDVLGTSNGPRGWNLLALIARNVIQLDLCIESAVFLSSTCVPATGSLRRVAITEPQSWIEDEGRRRLCWMIYILDRYATITTTYDFMLDDKVMERFLPCRYDLFSRNVPVETRSLDWADRSRQGPSLNRPENLGSFSYHCEVLRILSRVHEFLKRPIDIGNIAEVQSWQNAYRDLDGELNSWLHGLPGEYSKISQLCHSDPASRVANWIMLHAAFVTSVIRLHASAAYPTVRSHIFKPSHYAMQRCLTAVESLRDIAQDVLNTNGLDLLGPPFAFSLWVSARLLLVHAATMECEVDPKIQFFISTLRDMGQYWEVAENYAKILTRVVQEGQHPDQQMTFTTMRRRAYDLSLLSTSRRTTALHLTSTHQVSLSELEYIDVFDFFNYPRLSTNVMSGLLDRSLRSPSESQSTANIMINGSSGSSRGFDGSTPLGNRQQVQSQRIRSLSTSTAPPANTFTNSQPSSSQQDDWLHFQPPYD